MDEKTVRPGFPPFLSARQSRAKIRSPVKRLAHILRKSIIVLSLPLFVTMGSLWVRSHWASDEIAFLVGRHDVLFVSGVGAFRLTWYSDRPIRLEPGWTVIAPSPQSPLELCSYQLLGIGFDYGDDYAVAGFPRQRHRTLVLPYWFTTTLAALPAILWSATLIKRLRRRSRPDHCRSCGYDLRVTLGRCPECGTWAQPIPVDEGVTQIRK